MTDCVCGRWLAPLRPVEAPVPTAVGQAQAAEAAWTKTESVVAKVALLRGERAAATSLRGLVCADARAMPAQELRCWPAPAGCAAAAGAPRLALHLAEALQVKARGGWQPARLRACGPGAAAAAR